MEVTRRAVAHGPSVIPPEMTDEERREQNRKAQRHDTKKYRKRKEEVMEELVPKASTSRESKIDKSKMRAQKKSEKEDNDEVINEYDDGANSFKAMLDRQQEWRDSKNSSRREKIQQKMGEYRVKEDKTMAMLRELAQARGYL